MIDLNKNQNIMVDIETLGTGANSVILSIGAVAFNNEGITSEFYRVVDLQSCMNAGLEIDASTLLWWMNQSDDARKLFNSTAREILPVALSKFSGWLPQNACIWGNGASFDNTILANAFDKAGVALPWKYWNDRCYRTVKNLYPNIKLERVGTYHNALDDAKSQALHLIEIAKHTRVDFEGKKRMGAKEHGL